MSPPIVVHHQPPRLQTHSTTITTGTHRHYRTRRRHRRRQLGMQQVSTLSDQRPW